MTLPTDPKWDRLNGSLKLIHLASAAAKVAYHDTWEALGGWDGDPEHAGANAGYAHSVCVAAQEASDAAFIEALDHTASCWQGDDGLRSWNGVIEPIMNRRARQATYEATGVYP